MDSCACSQCLNFNFFILVLVLHCKHMRPNSTPERLHRKQSIAALLVRLDGRPLLRGEEKKNGKLISVACYPPIVVVSLSEGRVQRAIARI